MSNLNKLPKIKKINIKLNIYLKSTILEDMFQKCKESEIIIEYDFFYNKMNQYS